MTVTIRPGTTVRPKVTVKGFSVPPPVETVTLISGTDYYAGSSATRNGTVISIIGKPASTKITKLLSLAVGNTLTMTTNIAGATTVTLATAFTTSDAGSGLLYYNADSVENVAFSFIQGDVVFNVPITGGGAQTFNVNTDYNYAAPTFGGGVTVRDLRPAFVTALSGLAIGSTFIGVSGGQQYTFTVTTAFTFTNNGASGFPNYDGYATISPSLAAFSDITSFIIG